MANILGERKVIFSGLWLASPRRDVDVQLRLISEEFVQKPGLPSSFQLTDYGVELHIISDNGLSGKNKKIRYRDIYDLLVNKYHPLCLIVVYADEKNPHNFLVCQCHSPSDGQYFSKKYQECRIKYGDRVSFKSESERKNWVLKPRVSNNNEGEDGTVTAADKITHEQSETQSDSLATSIDSSGYHSVLVHSQSSRTDESVSNDATESISSVTESRDLDGDSVVSMETYNAMKDELITLSQEVRNIKRLLQQQGINPETLQQNADPRNLHGGDQQSPPESPKNGNDRKVNFSVTEDNKIYSDGLRKIHYVKHQNGHGGNPRVRIPSRGHHSRTSSSGHSGSSVSPAYIGPNDVFEYPQKALPVYGSTKRSTSGAVTTIQKPIEQVYQIQPRQSHSVRRQIILHPGQSSTLPIVRRSLQDKTPTPILKNGHQ